MTPPHPANTKLYDGGNFLPYREDTHALSALPFFFLKWKSAQVHQFQFIGQDQDK